MRRKPESQRCNAIGGVTLLELMVVLGVLAILTGILLPVVGSVRRRAVQLRCESSLVGIGKMYSAYASEHDGAWATFEYPRRLSGMVDVHRVQSWGRSGGWLILPINEMTFWGFLLRDYAVPDSETAIRQAVERLSCPVAFDRWVEGLPAEERDGRVEILNPMASPQESYYHSLALLTQPSGWAGNGDEVPRVNALHAEVQTSWVRRPSHKAVLVEKRSYHDVREERIESAASVGIQYSCGGWAR